MMLGNLQMMEKDAEGRFFCKPIHYQVQAALELEINLHGKSAKAGRREASLIINEGVISGITHAIS